MKHIDLLLPFSLPPAEHARDLLASLRAPALATLLARAAAGAPVQGDLFARSLPHERWLAREAGLDAPEEDSPAAAAALMDALKVGAADKGAGHWFIVQPVHFHIARDHLVLTDPRLLALEAAESRGFFDAAAPLFAEAGMALHWGDAAHWFVRADAWQGLQTATPEAATGHNIDIWLPRGEQARAWRRLQNEVQMHWHAAGLNDAREARGAEPVNTLWLWGGSAGSVRAAAPWTAHAGAPAWAAPLAGAAHDQAASLLDAAGERGLVVASALAEAALGGDWGEWLLRATRFDEAWAAPLLAALRSGKLGSLRLLAGGPTELRPFTITPLALRKFWRAPSFARLAP